MKATLVPPSLVQDITITMSSREAIVLRRLCLLDVSLPLLAIKTFPTYAPYPSELEYKNLLNALRDAIEKTTHDIEG